MIFKKVIVLCLIFSAILGITAGAVTANQTSSKVLVNDEEMKFDAYNIDESNYFKLRDIAYVLNGTSCQFQIGWDAEKNTVLITTGESYTPDGSEMTVGTGQSRSAYTSTAKILIDGVEASLDAYNIGDNNYVKLRHLAVVIGFDVDWDDDANAVIINE